MIFVFTALQFFLVMGITALIAKIIERIVEHFMDD